MFCDLYDKYGNDFNWYMIPFTQADGAFVAELNKEIGQDHFLYGKKIWAVAKCESNDDVLYVLRNGTGRDIYYLFHLTYSAHNTDGFPRYEEFADLFAVKEFIERSYIEDYIYPSNFNLLGIYLIRSGNRKEAVAMSTWSGIRNKLESDYLCPALRGHIQYFATSYSKSADHEGRAAIRVDGVEVLRSNYYTYFENVWTKFHHLRSTTLKDHDSAKEAINQAHAYALEQGTFDQKVFYEAFGIFDNQSIEKSLTSENPLVRIFALLDRRLGKRRLLALEESMEQELDWVRAFYVIRMQAEGLIDKE